MHRRGPPIESPQDEGTPGHPEEPEATQGANEEKRNKNQQGAEPRSAVGWVWMGPDGFERRAKGTGTRSGLAGSEAAARVRRSGVIKARQELRRDERAAVPEDTAGDLCDGDIHRLTATAEP
ncbi:hypothetical protein KM043_008165 [Ampulex compressa]|nr:hypothetical protein KM043_008165 [Ampulex compressa]